MNRADGIKYCTSKVSVIFLDFGFVLASTYMFHVMMCVRKLGMTFCVYVLGHFCRDLSCHNMNTYRILNCLCLEAFLVCLFDKCCLPSKSSTVTADGFLSRSCLMLCNVTLATIVFSSLTATRTSSTVLSVRLPPAERVRSLHSGSSQHSNSWITLSRPVTLVALV